MMRHIHPRKQTDYIGKNLIKQKPLRLQPVRSAGSCVSLVQLKSLKNRNLIFMIMGQGLAKNK